MNPTHPPWPKLNEAYADEFGQIEPEVYHVAGELWPQAAAHLSGTLRDHAAGLRLMLKAAALISRVRREQPDHIQDLPAYLWRTFERMVQAELKRARRQQPLDPALETAAQRAPAAALDDQILIEELLRRLSPSARLLFELRLLDYEFEEIAHLLGKRPNVLRSRFSKEIKKLRRLFDR